MSYWPPGSPTVWFGYLGSTVKIVDFMREGGGRVIPVKDSYKCALLYNASNCFNTVQIVDF